MVKYKGDKEYWYPDIQNLESKNIKVGNSLPVTIYKCKESNKRPNIEESDLPKLKYQKVEGDCKTKFYNLPLTRKQQKLLLDWSFVYTRVYNKARQFDKENPDQWSSSKLTWKNKVLTSWRKVEVEDDGKKTYTYDKFLLDADKIYKDRHSIAHSVCEYHKNKKSSLTNLKNGNIKHFTIRPKTYNSQFVVMEFDKRTCNKTNKIGKIVWKYRHLIDRQFAIQFNKCNRTAKLIVRVPLDQYEKTDQTVKAVSIDLGLRTFASCYDFKKYMCIGNNNNKLNKLIDRANKPKMKSKSKKSLQNYRRKRFRKIKNIVKDMHYKTAHYLCKKYSEIYVGDIHSKKCKEAGNNKTVKRRLNQYSFYQFKTTLDYIAQKYNANVFRWNEYLTSRCCSWCGYDHKELGNSEIYDCPKCEKKTYRDCNAARNGMIVTLKTKNCKISVV